MVALGRERYRKKVNRARASGHETHTVAGRYLLKESVARIEDALVEWKLRASVYSPGGPRFSVYPLVDSLPTGVVALVAMKVVLDQVARERAYQTTALAIAGHLEDEAQFRALFEAVPPQSRRLLRTYFETGYRELRTRVRAAVDQYKVEWTPWPRREKVRLGMMLLEMIRQHTGLIDIKNRPTETGRSKLVIVPDDISLAWLEEAHEKHETLFPFYLPLDSPPAPWESLHDGGYYTDALSRRPLVKTYDRGALIRLDAAPMPEVYSAVNTLQDVGWFINDRVHHVLSTLWDQGSTLAGLPLRDDQRPPPPPDDYKTNIANAKAWRRGARIIHDANRRAASRRLMVAKILYMADMYSGGPFYYPVQLDFRGRLYPIPFFLQPQGTSMARSLLHFAESEPIVEEDQYRWWKIHGANLFGFDKVTLDERVEAVDSSLMDVGIECARDAFGSRKWVEADKPWEFLAWCYEALDIHERGTWVGYESRIPVQMDGSNNGLQIFSLLLRDEVGGRATNCLPSTSPQDIYQQVADRVTEKLAGHRDEGQAFGESWRRVVPDGLPRAAVKRQVMTLPYGATSYSCHQYTMDWYLELRDNPEVPNPFPRDYYTPCWWLSRLIWEAIGEVVVSARSGMAWLQAVASACHRAGRPVVWTTPVGFVVTQNYTKYETSRIKTTYGDSVRVVNVRDRSDDICARQQRQGISPNFVHSLDAAALVRTVCLASSAGVNNFMMVHDSFGTTAASAPRLAEALRRAYVEIFSEDLLDGFRDEVLASGVPEDTIPPVPEYGSLDISALTSSSYFFA